MRGLSCGIHERPIVVLLADDHPVVRVGIKRLLETTGGRVSITGEASNGLEVLEFARSNTVDLYLLDIAMPEMNGLLTTQKLLQQDPSAKIIILSMYSDRALVRNAFRSGAKGYIVKSSATEDIVRAITEVHHGHFFVSPSVAEHVVEVLARPKSDGDAGVETDGLTRRQREVLTLLCEGMTEKEIAYRLELSYNTVHRHKYSLMHRLELHSTAELVKYAVRTGLVPVEPQLPSGPEQRRRGATGRRKQ